MDKYSVVIAIIFMVLGMLLDRIIRKTPKPEKDAKERVSGTIRASFRDIETGKVLSWQPSIYVADVYCAVTCINGFTSYLDSPCARGTGDTIALSYLDFRKNYIVKFEKVNSREGEEEGGFYLGSLFLSLSEKYGGWKLSGLPYKNRKHFYHP